jgi:serine/threonine protein kinase
MMSDNNETVLNGRYRLVSQQGSGGMAVIYRAIDMSLGRTVAVKILRPSLITNDSTFLRRFRDEARAIANLSHPNIVTVHDVGNDGQTHYIVMEYVEGQDLKKIIRTEGVLTVKRTLDLAIQICDGIGFAHRAGLVHADVKPQNILVANDDRVKVTDFGIAQMLTDTQPMQRQEVVWGSPHYFSPEQARGEKPTPASDVYSIGIVMFEMLTGRLPYTGASQQELALAHLREPVPLVSDFNPSVPENLAKIVYKVMSKEPSMRYSIADQLGNILKSYRERSQQHTALNMPSSSSPPMPQASVPLPPPPPLRTGSMSQPPPPMPAASQPTFPLRSDSQRPPNVPVVSGRIPAQPAPSQGSQNTPSASAPYGRQDAASGRQPAPPAPGRPAAQPAQPGGFQPIGPSASGQPGAVSDSSQVYRSRPLSSQSQSYRPEYRGGSSSGLDFATVLLALIALLAVGGLIPLYIWVLQAYTGG